MRRKEITYIALIIFASIIIWRPTLIRIIIGIIFSLIFMLTGIILILHAFQCFSEENLSFIEKCVCFIYSFLSGLGFFIPIIGVIAFILGFNIRRFLSTLLEILFGFASLPVLMAFVITTLTSFIKKCFKRK